MASENAAPTITSESNYTANEDNLFSFTFSASDAESDAITFYTTNKPDWLTTFIDNGDNTATLSGTPSNLDVGTTSFTLKVADALGKETTKEVSLTVNAINDAPVDTTGPTITNFTIVDNTLSTDEDITILFNAEDPSGLGGLSVRFNHVDRGTEMISGLIVGTTYSTQTALRSYSSYCSGRTEAR